MKAIKAINNYVVLEPEKKGQQTTPSGLVLPESKEVKMSVGTVVSAPTFFFAGSEQYLSPVKSGDRVLYSPSLGIEYQNVLIYPLLNIYAVLE